MNESGLLARDSLALLPNARASVDDVLSRLWSVAGRSFSDRSQTESLTVAGPRRIHTGFQVLGPVHTFGCHTESTPVCAIDATPVS